MAKGLALERSGSNHRLLKAWREDGPPGGVPAKLPAVKGKVYPSVLFVETGAGRILNRRARSLNG
jgi:hypothetical protein